MCCCMLQSHNVFQPLHVLSAASQELEPCGAHRSMRKHCRRTALQHLVQPALARKQAAAAAAAAACNATRDKYAAAAAAACGITLDATQLLLL